MTVDTWNPRYINYCRAHGVQNPEEMLRVDDEKHPGGVMCGFLLWNQVRIREFCKETGVKKTPGWNEFEIQSCLIAGHQAEYDAWLTEWVKKNGGVRLVEGSL